jgi:nicotinate phosphoribosyltransferase
MYRFQKDRYHAVMGNTLVQDPLGSLEAVFYISQRKGISPVLGHSTLLASLFNSPIDPPHARFLQEDRAGLGMLAERLTQEGRFMGRIRLVPEGTIIFPGEPFCDVRGPFWNTQHHEVLFQHAFDLPMTVGNRALKIRQAAGKDAYLSVFSLRRDGDSERSLRVSRAAYISGFDDTSDLDAAFELGIPSVGTMAHYWVQSFIGNRDEKGKHFEQVAFERWLDANPKGTVLLIDTYDYRKGIIHAIRAALSTLQRKTAFKGIRIDSGNLIEASKYCRQLLDRNGLKNVNIILTGDLEEKKIREIRKVLDFPVLIRGYGIGTKLAAETSVVGVVFKMCAIDDIPTMKSSGTPGKETLPGILQVWRCVDSKGNYVQDIIALNDESRPRSTCWDAHPLLEPFWGPDVPLYQDKPLEELKEFVKVQLGKFTVPLEEYPVEPSPKLAQLKESVLQSIKDENDYPEMKGGNE